MIKNMKTIFLMLALLAGAAQAAPTFQAAGNGVGGAGTVNPAWPVHVSGDIALLFVESTGGEPVTLSTPAGFVQVTDSPQATGATTNGTQLTVFWARATSAAMAAPTVADSGDHVYARILTYRGVISTGNPWDSTGGGVKAAASNSISVTGITTTVDDTLIVQAASHDRDNTGAHFSNQTNANLTGIVERSDAGTNSGNGGGFAVWDGVMATAGATGDTTASLSRSLVNAFLTIALRAVPPALPAATTNAATAITTSTATLNGTVSSNGAITTVVIDYGPDTSYGSTATAAQSPLASGATNTAVSAALIGLSCGTTYHFRVRATNSVGTTNGNDLNFTTTACPAPTATTNAVSSLTTTSALLNGTVNDNGSVTTVTFQYGLSSPAYGSTVTATQSPLGPNWGSMGVSATASGLNCGTTYHYRVRAVSAAGTTDGGDQLFTTAACPTNTSVTRSPGGCVDNAGVGANTWTALDAVASDNTYATTSLNDWAQSHYLVCTNYGFAIPAGSTINGIVVNVERSATGSQIQDLRMRAVKAGAIGATDRSTATQYPINTDTVEAHGGAADLWGTTWTVANINAANFGAALAAYKNGSSGGARTVNVDHMPITVYYTPSTPWVNSITRVSSNPTAASTSVSWDVLFSGNASGVDIADFELVMGGAATGASITSVTINGTGRVWTVTANTGTGATGTLGLNLADNDTITVGGVPLGGAGDNADFTGEVYTIDIPVCTGSMIYCDDFERANYGAVGNGWTIIPGGGADCNGVVGNSGCAGIDTDIPPFNATTNRANPTRSMFTRWSVVTVESRAIDLSGYPSALLSFWMRRGGDSFSEYPEAVGEDYLVKYLDNTGTWRILAQYPTGVQQGQVFTPVIQLPPDAMHANFKLQFFQPAGSGDANGGATGGAPGVVGYDYWHFDNVIITEAPESSYVGAFCDNFEAGLGRWSISAEGAPPTAAIGDAALNVTDFLSATHELDMRWGYVSVSTLRTDMTGVGGDITYWVKSGTTGARDPDAGEDLVVEYRNISGVWTNLATYPGSAAAGTIYNASHVMPDDAKHTGFRLRFRQLNGSAYDNDYWHVDDVCVGTPQANADLSITKTRSGPLVPGSNGTYILAVTNNGPQDMSGTIEVVDTLPAALSFFSANGTGWTCSANGQIVTCSYVGSLANGATTSPITLTVAVSPSATGSITNTATVTGTVNDSNLANNSASNTATLTPGFMFTDGPCVHGIAFGGGGQTCNVLSWSSLIAGQDFANVYITSVNTSSVPTQLSGSVATVINMEFGLTCHNPVADAGVQATFSATGSALELCEPNGGAPADWTAGVNLSFPAGNPSVGPYTFNYADVGQVELYARNSVSTTQVGLTGPFVVKPAGFVLSQIRCTTANAANCGAGALPSGNNPGAASAAGATFIRAGDPFSVTVTAVNTLGDATPNYGMESSPESVLLTPANALANMVTAPAIAGSFGSFASGVATGTAFTWNEVGIITLSPRVGDGNYLGAGNVTGTTSGNVGRFYPHHFDTVVSQVAGAPIPCQPLPMVCPTNYNGIVYSGQEFGLTVTAMNAGGGVTVNYNTTTELAKTAELTVVGNLGTDDAVTGAGGLGVSNVSAFAAGTITSNIEEYTFNAVSAPSDIYIRAIDTDSVSSKRLVDPVGTSEEGGVKVVSGRFKISNAYGSQQIPLLLTATVQYWDGAAWLTSSTDDITTFSTATNLTKTIVSGPLAVANINAVGAGAVTVADGVKTFSLLAPGVAGSADIGLNAPAYLLTGGIPGRVTFGVYKNKNNYIYRREN